MRQLSKAHTKGPPQYARVQKTRVSRRQLLQDTQRSLGVPYVISEDSKVKDLIAGRNSFPMTRTVRVFCFAGLWHRGSLYGYESKRVYGKIPAQNRERERERETVNDRESQGDTAEKERERETGLFSVFRTEREKKRVFMFGKNHGKSGAVDGSGVTNKIEL